jgi:hypothetical protein
VLGKGFNWVIVLCIVLQQPVHHECYYKYFLCPGCYRIHSFSKLRELDDMGAEKIYVRIPDKKGIGLAVYNRLLRAAGFEVIKL